MLHEIQKNCVLLWLGNFDSSGGEVKGIYDTVNYGKITSTYVACRSFILSERAKQFFMEISGFALPFVLWKRRETIRTSYYTVSPSFSHFPRGVEYFSLRNSHSLVREV